MAYCPEDGSKMNVVKDEHNICYDCQSCGMHWFYDGEIGGYLVQQPRESCANDHEELADEVD